MITLKYYANKRLSLQEAGLKAVSTASSKQGYSHIISVDVQESESSYRYRALMEKPSITLKFNLPVYIEFPVGTFCVYQNETYTLLTPATIKKAGVRSIEYTLTMGGDEYNLSRYKFRNPVDGRLKWSACSTPTEFVEYIVSNLNDRDGAGTWKVGTCITANEKTIEFNHASLDAALSTIADEFETEWEIKDKVISVHKVEYFKDSPVALSYGRGNGFVPNLGRSSSVDELPVERLFVQGGEQNIDRSTYGSQYLLLPKSQEYTYEGRTYQTDADGLYITRKGSTIIYNNEDSLDLSDIYPSRVGSVTSVEVQDESKNFYDIIDNTIPSDLNFNDYIIEGESMTLIFQSGMLAGREFELKYKHAERRFELVPLEEDGYTFPNSTFAPKVGDTYAIFGIMLPSAYICNDSDQSGASWDMFKEACRYKYENEDQKFTFTGEVQALWLKRNWLTYGGKLIVGGYVHFTDDQFAKEGTDIRIIGVKDYLFNPYAPTLTISSDVSGSSISSQLNKIESQEVLIEDSKKSVIRFTKRRFRDAQETMQMLSDALLGYGAAVTPVSVQTMMLLVGDESLQFSYVDNATDQNVVEYSIVYDVEHKQLSCPVGYIKHFTLGISSISSQHAKDEYKVWRMDSYTSPVLTDTDQKYYFYAKVPRTPSESTNGIYLLSPTAKDMDCEDGYYYLLVGVLNSEYENERSFVTLYGFTEVLPSRITTDRIVSSDGKNYLNLVGNAIHFGDDNNYLDWNNQQEATLLLSNATIANTLKVLGDALIAGFYFNDDVIKSTDVVTQSGVNYPALKLDGKNGKIELRSTGTGGAYSLDTIASTIKVDAPSGEVEARNSNGVAYLSASGVFCNNAKTNALPSSTGYTHYGSIIGLGFGSVNKSDWVFDQDETIVTGVYGRASNSGSANCYGGYFWDLVARGLVLGIKYVTDSQATTALTLSQFHTQLVGLANKGKTALVYLPNDGYEGRVIYAKQVGQGQMRFYPQSGYKIFDDIAENEYYDIPEGYEAKFTFCKFVLNGSNVSAWLISRWKF